MKRWLLIPKQIPRLSDAAELAMSGVKVIDIMFGGAVLVVESNEDLKYTLDSTLWTVEEDNEVSTSDAANAS